MDLVEIDIDNKIFDIDMKIDDMIFEICNIEITYSMNDAAHVYLVDEIGSVLTDELGNRLII